MQSATDGFTFSPVRVRRRETARAPSAVMVPLFCNESQGEVEGDRVFFLKKPCLPSTRTGEEGAKEILDDGARNRFQFFPPFSPPRSEVATM